MRRWVRCWTILTILMATAHCISRSPSVRATEPVRYNFPLGLAVDGGLVYVADAANNRIRVIDGSGRVSTVVGTGVAGFSGDGGPARTAAINYPAGLAVSAGTLYFADMLNHRVRAIAPSGTIRTVAGTGVGGFGGDGGPATAARLSSPADVAIDADGNVLIADSFNDRIRKVDDSGRIWTIAGSSLSEDPLEQTEEYLGTDVGDGGPAVGARLSQPSGVDVAPSGEILVADTGHNRVRAIDPAGIIRTMAGRGAPAIGYVPAALGDGGDGREALLNAPQDIAALVSGRVLIADQTNHRIRMVDASGVITTIAGTGLGLSYGDGGPATLAGLNRPVRMAADGHGSILIVEYRGHRIRIINSDGTVGTYSGTGEAGYSGDS